MNKKIILFFFVLLAILYSCTTKNESSHLHENEKKEHWSYTGETSPENWAEIEKNSDCEGQYQSPINIIENNTIPINSKDDLKIFYSPNTHISKVLNNGHSIQFDFETGDSIKFNEEIYYLKQIHFHEPSEHKINGVIYPIEVHLVHVSNKNQLSVFSVLGMEGQESELFEFFKSFLPLENGKSKKIDKEINLTKLSLENRDYFFYGGSLTTPPCTESVNWFVFKNPIIVSLEEVLALKSNMPLNNYRNEQPLNGRTVYNKYENN